MPLPAGRLRNRITIRRATDTPTAAGGQSRSWSTLVAGLPAEVLGQYGRESVIANTLQGISTFRITIRPRSDIRIGDQVIWGTRELNIISPPSDPTGRGEMMDFLADTSAPQQAGV